MSRHRYPRVLTPARVANLEAGRAIKQALKQKKTEPLAPVAKCPVHGIPDCSPLLNGCSWKPEGAK